MINETQQLQASLTELETKEKKRDGKIGCGCLLTIVALISSIIAFFSGDSVLGIILLAAFLVPNVLIMVVLTKGSSEKSNLRERIEDLNRKAIDLETHLELQSIISELSGLKSKALEILEGKKGIV